MPIELCRELRLKHPHTKYVVFLDNLFLNVSVAHALLKFDIGCMGTTRKNAEGLPSDLLEAKAANRVLQWNQRVALVVGRTLCFLWQDNNAVLGITTAFSLHREED